MALRLIRRGSRPADALSQDPTERPPGEPPHRTQRSNRPWIMLVLVLGAAAVGFLVMERSAGPRLPQQPALALQGEPDIYMESPVVSQYRDDGRLEYRLVASTASHYQGPDLTLLELPRLTLFRREGPPWQVTARKGTLRRPPGAAAEESVTLDQDVVLESTENGERMRLTTSLLHLFPQREYAETDQNVNIESLFGRTSATGLEGDLRQGRLELHSARGGRVHTVLQPEQFK